MRNFLKAVVSVSVAAVILLSMCLCASAQSATQPDIKFSAYCRTVEEIDSAVSCGASYIATDGAADFAYVYEAVQGKAIIIIDAADVDEAEAKYNEVLSSGEAAFENVAFRIKGSASKAVKWAESKPVKPALIGIYTGNIYPAALAGINRYGKYKNIAAVQLQTGNQDGVILHDTVTFMFEKVAVNGMFSFVNTAKSAARTDTARSWDDLVARGYDVIETAYPQDFAEYLNENTAEYKKLEDSIVAAKNADIKTAFPNRISAYESALEAAEALLNDGSCAVYEMADARAVLDEAVANLNIDDGKKVKGDFEITPGRIAWALFGVALVLSWQIYFRKKWGKKA